MAHGILPAGIKAKAHQHPYETAIYILAGSVRVFWGKGLAKTTDLQEGDFLFIPANVPHGPQNFGDIEMKYIVARNTAEEEAESLE